MRFLKEYIKRINWINEAYISYKWKERKVSWGKENPEKTFYIIRRAKSKVGLFSYVLTCLGHIDYAISQGYIPVIDMQNYENTYLSSNEIGQLNVWELFFKQPCQYYLHDIGRSKNIILSNGLLRCGIAFPGGKIAFDKQELVKWQAVVRKYLIINEDILLEAEHMYDSLFGTEKVLGVLARGTDYVISKPVMHPIQPTCEQLISKSREVLENFDCEKIFIVTEDACIYKAFRESFGDNLFSYEQKRYSVQDGENINDVIANKRENAKDYLLAILLLSKCNYLVGGNAGGSQAALLLNKKGYEYTFIFDLGTY